MQRLKLVRPDDWHLHLRDGEVLAQTVAASAKDFARALVMPNLIPALTTIEQLNSYRQRIISQGHSSSFIPYMTLYLNESVTPETIAAASKEPYILGAKLYPKGATTNSSAGPGSIKTLYPLLEQLQAHDLVLQVHGEVTHGDVFSREALFLREILQPISKQFPTLRIVLEHISSKAAVEFVQQAPKRIAATITPHHLLYNRNHLLAQGLRPHYYCLPILKQARDQKAIQQAAIESRGQFFAGTDSAPHAIEDKQSACGCAGIYSAPFALPLYAQVFSAFNQLKRLEAFTSYYGADFYQLEPNKEEVELIEKPQTIPAQLPFGKQTVIPIGANETIAWSVQHEYH